MLIVNSNQELPKRNDELKDIIYLSKVDEHKCVPYI